MPHRDPETGQFMSGGKQYDDVETATFAAQAGVEAANVSGATGFAGGQRAEIEGIELLDYDEFVDRNEDLQLLGGWHAVTAYINSTGTADGTVRAAVEISASPSISQGYAVQAVSLTGATVTGSLSSIQGKATRDDSIDVIGRPLVAVGTQPITDGASGVGGGGSAGEDRYEVGMPPAEMGRFHPRDELFANIELAQWNVADAGIHVDVWGQHWYGVHED